jgi:hypothetical protein
MRNGMAKRDDQEARVRKARALRRRIDAIVGGAEPPAKKSESPRDFVHRRMRELAAERSKAKKRKRPTVR